MPETLIIDDVEYETITERGTKKELKFVIKQIKQYGGTYRWITEKVDDGEHLYRVARPVREIKEEHRRADRHRRIMAGLLKPNNNITRKCLKCGKSFTSKDKSWCKDCRFSAGSEGFFAGGLTMGVYDGVAS